MNYIEFLDRVLVWLDERGSFRVTKDNVSSFTQEENNMLPQALMKLVIDDYAFITNDSTTVYSISFEGKLALMNTTQEYKNRPYAYALHKQKIEERKNMIKNVAVVANAVIALILAAAALF